MVDTRRPFRRSSPENAARDGAGRATLTAARRPGRRARKAPLRLRMKSPRRRWRPSRRPSTYQMNASRSVTFAGRAGSFWRTANAVTRIALLAENADAEPVSLPNLRHNGYEVVAHVLGVARGFNAVRRGADDGPEMISARGLARNRLFGDVRAIARRPITASGRASAPCPRSPLPSAPAVIGRREATAHPRTSCFGPSFGLSRAESISRSSSEPRRGAPRPRATPNTYATTS